MAGAKRQLEADRSYLEPVLTTVRDAAVELSGADYASMRLLDRETAELRSPTT
jgi:hypothetical protein